MWGAGGGGTCFSAKAVKRRKYWGGREQGSFSLLIFSLPPCGVCRSSVPSVYSINYKRKKANANRVASGGASRDPITLLAKEHIGITELLRSACSPEFGNSRAKKVGCDQMRFASAGEPLPERTIGAARYRPRCSANGHNAGETHAAFFRMRRLRPRRLALLLRLLFFFCIFPLWTLSQLALAPCTCICL